MALTKINYVSGKTVITAKNLNEIQDAILDLERKGGVGMGITGATVGQIAKISAVDASGVGNNPRGEIDSGGFCRTIIDHRQSRGGADRKPCMGHP